MHTRRPLPNPAWLLGLALVAGCKLDHHPGAVPGAPVTADRTGAVVPVGDERYAPVAERAFVRVVDERMSTFGVDVDTAAYSNVRRFLEGGRLPPVDAVRIEEMINYFAYDHERPAGEQPVAVTASVGACPWAPRHRLLMIGARARAVDGETAPPRNLVFLLDVSGSMRGPDRLPLVKLGMRRLAKGLRPVDSVAIVTYRSTAEVLLPPTSGRDRDRILAAIDGLEAAGATNGGAGIEMAYRLARERLAPGGSNRVLLATDGDFNVGTVDDEALADRVGRERKAGIFLTVIGVGTDNLNDRGLHAIANRGNGTYLYVDGTPETRKAFMRELDATLVTVARDVKIQVEFNPANVQSYRLIGYESRALAASDFNDDRVDSGEMGAGHTVTALYEVVPTGTVDPLRYERSAAPAPIRPEELAWVKLRYRDPDGAETAVSRRIDTIVRADAPPTDRPALRFASAVAAFGMLLRDSPHKGDADWSMVRRLAQSALVPDPSGDRHAFLRLVDRAEDLDELVALGG